MSHVKIAAYSLIVAVVILALLISMLRIDDVRELIIAKWAVSGILSAIVIAISMVTLRRSELQRTSSSPVLVGIKVVAIPLLVMAIVVAGWLLVGQEVAMQQVFFEPPLGPFVLPFLASFGCYVVYLYLTRKTRRMR